MLKNLQIKANVQLIRTCVLVRYLEHGPWKGLPDRPATYLIDLGKHIKKEGLKQPILFPVGKITERTCIYKKKHWIGSFAEWGYTLSTTEEGYSLLNEDNNDQNLISYLA